MIDGDGRPVALGNRVGRGGEGSVYAIVNRPEAVAKIYHRPPAPEHALKLAAMVRRQNPALISVAAWPTDLLHERSGGALLGFVMPRLAGLE